VRGGEEQRENDAQNKKSVTKKKKRERGGQQRVGETVKTDVLFSSKNTWERGGEDRTAALAEKTPEGKGGEEGGTGNEIKPTQRKLGKAEKIRDHLCHGQRKDPGFMAPRKHSEREKSSSWVKTKVP